MLPDKLFTFFGDGCSSTLDEGLLHIFELAKAQLGGYGLSTYVERQAQEEDEGEGVEETAVDGPSFYNWNKKRPGSLGAPDIFFQPEA